MGSLWWQQCPVTVLGEDMANAGLCALEGAEDRESLGQRFSTCEWRSCGSRSCNAPEVTSRLPWLQVSRKTEGWVPLLSCHLAMLTQSAPCSGSHGKGEEGVGSRVQMDMVLLISKVLTSARGLMEEGGGWMLPDWSRLNMKNNMARSRTRWAARAGGLFCFTVLLSLSPPLGFVALSCRAGKLFIQTTAPTTPSVSICGSRLLCSSGWDVVNSSSSPSRPPVRQDTKHGAAGCATEAAIPNSLGETCRPICVTNPCLPCLTHC